MNKFYLHFFRLFLFCLQASLLFAWSAWCVVTIFQVFSFRLSYSDTLSIIFLNLKIFLFITHHINIACCRISWCLKAIKLLKFAIESSHLFFRKVSNHLCKWLFLWLILIHLAVVFINIFFMIVDVSLVAILWNERYIWYHVDVLGDLWY